MLSRTKKTFSQVAYVASKSFKLPYALILTMRLISIIQIMCLILSDSLLSQQKDNMLAKSIGSVFSGIKSALMFSQIDSEIAARVFAYTCYSYILSMFGILIFTMTQLYRTKTPNHSASKLLAFVGLIQNHILFYPMHSFFMRFIYLNTNCETNRSFEIPFYCSLEWIIVPVAYEILMFTLGLLREIYCYNVLNKTKTASAKDNLYPLVIFTHKAVMIPLTYFFKNSTTLLTILNLGFCFLGLSILQIRLPFYDLNMLRLEVKFSSMALFLSLFMLTQIFDNGSYAVIMLLVIPLGMKLSALKLEHTLTEIIKTKPKDPNKAIHLPILVEAYFEQQSKLLTENQAGKNLLLFHGLVKPHLNDTDKMTEDTINQVYKFTLEKLEALLKIYPKKQLLLVCMAQIYVNKIKDAPKAIRLLNRLKAQRLSIPMKNSLEDLYSDLDEMYIKAAEEPRRELYYLNYFEYRERTIKLKNLIQKEVGQQTKFWEALKENPINVYRAINHAEKISLIQNKIESLWRKKLQSLEKVYVNALVLYGAYLEIVQDLPHLGVTLVKKASNLILSKNCLERKIMDISNRKSAIIISSSEPEQSGKIMDASSSVKKLFGIDKEHLIGSNIGGLLPKMMAKQHGIMIQSFHERFKYDLNANFTSYARTCNDEYFPVEINLHALPSLKKGLNIVAYIKKLANSESTIIVDYDGKILECSRDLQALLSLNGMENFVDLAKACPEFTRTNHAFNVLYAPEMTEIDSHDAYGYQPMSENEPLSATTKHSEYYKYKESTGILNNPTDVFSTRELLLTNKDNEDNIKTNTEIERTASNIVKTEDSPLLIRKQRDPSMKMARDEAEDICNEFKGKKKLKFHFSPLSSSLKTATRIIFETQIEPLTFSGVLYKIVKVKKLREYQVEVPSPTIISPERKSRIHAALEKANFRRKLTRRMTYVSTIPKSETEPLSVNEMFESNQDQSNEDIAKMNMHLINPSKRSKATSGLNSVKSSRHQNRQLNSIFMKQEINYATRLAIFTVFVSVLVVIISVCIDLTFSKTSLNNMNDSIDLIDLTNSRLFRLLAAWRGMLVLYSRSGKLNLDATPATIRAFREVIRSSSAELLDNNNKLRQRVNDFSDNILTKKFFEKKISLWVPYEGKTVNKDKVDLFTANQIITNKNIFAANVPGSVLNLKNLSEVIFALNNTANDCLIAVSESINDVKDFFDETTSNNVFLSKMILLFKNLALAVSFISLGILFKVILTAYRNLFKAVSKIDKQNAEERIDKIKKFAEYLSENPEDSIIFYQEHLSQISNHVKPTSERTKKKEMSYTRIFSTRDLLWNMYKHLSFSFVLMALIIVLFWRSFSTSMEGFDQLSRISSQIVTIYEYGGHISSIISNFYYALIFSDESVIKIRNDAPVKQLKVSLDFLGDANDKLLFSLTIPGKGIDDSTVENLLNNDLCKYVTASNRQTCIKTTDYNSIGLLGMNAKYYQTCGLPILDYLSAPSLAHGQMLLNNFGSTLGDMHSVLFDGYEALAGLLVSNFKREVDGKMQESTIFFKYNLALVLVMAFLIRIVVITKYKSLDLATKKILRLIPHDIIQKNKAIVFYLSKKYSKELSNNMNDK